VSSLRIPSVPACIFCGSGPTEVEDVIPKWMQAKLPRGLPKGQGVMTIAGDEKVPLTTHKSMPYNQRAKVVCRPCNNHWMSDIEDRASGHLKPMMFQDGDIVLDRAAQQKVATWGVLKTMLVPYLAPKPDRIVPDHYAEFRRIKEPLKIGQVVFLARHDGSQWPGFEAWSFVIEDKESSDALPEMKAYGVTFHVDNLVVQLIGFAFKTWIPRLHIPNMFLPYIKQVWPIQEDSIVWPPSVTMDSTTLLRFRSWFGLLFR
jgi:hypothetical protein